MIKIGFTGTRAPNNALLDKLVGLLASISPDNYEVITGACLGIDALVARQAFARGFSVHTIVPCNRSQVDPYWNQLCTTHELMPEDSSYKERNQRIVDQSDLLVAFAAYPEKYPKSGRGCNTWQTVRLARKAGLLVLEYLP